MQYLGWACSVVSLVCWVMTLIKIFPDKEKNGVVHGIIGIVTCGIWAFIWGWINSGRLNLKKLMIIWTVAIVLSWAFGGMSFVATMNAK